MSADIHNVLRLECRRGAHACAAGYIDILNNALFHSSPHISQTPHQIIHVLHHRLLDSLLNYYPSFCGQLDCG